MQKNVPRYLPEWVRTVTIWAEASRRDVTYALCDDWPTLKWFANQRAIEYHPTLVRVDRDPPQQTHLVLDLDPPEGAPFEAVVAVAQLVRRALDDAGLHGALKTSGAKGVHILVPIAQPASGRRSPPPRARSPPAPSGSTRRSRRPPTCSPSAAAECSSTRRALTARRSSPPTARACAPARPSPSRLPGTPSPAPTRMPSRSTPCRRLLDGGDPWAELMPAPQALPAELVEEGREIPVARVAAMHEGKRRAPRQARGGELGSRLWPEANTRCSSWRGARSASPTRRRSTSRSPAGRSSTSSSTTSPSPTPR